MPFTREERKILADTIQVDANNAEQAIGEAMQAAALETPPARTKMKRIRGVPVTGPKRVTTKMRNFASLVAAGKSPREAYRIAYDAEGKREHLVVSSASRLMRDARIQALTAEVWEHVKENIIDDNIAARRYIMEQLKSHADNAKQDSAKLKALELMGRAIGMFTDKVEQKVEEISTDQLKKELETSLSPLDNVVPIHKDVA